MKKNIGTQDRIIRLGMAILILLLSLIIGSWLLFFISLFVFYEAFAGWCVLYQLLGKNTCEKN